MSRSKIDLSDEFKAMLSESPQAPVKVVATIAAIQHLLRTSIYLDRIRQKPETYLDQEREQTLKAMATASESIAECCALLVQPFLAAMGYDAVEAISDKVRIEMNRVDHELGNPK